MRIAPDLHLPAVFQASLSIERELWKKTLTTIEYQTLRGLHLFRSINLNAPWPLTFLRADASFLNINQVETSASMRGHALTVTWRGSWGKWFSGMARYALSSTKNDTSGPFELPANNLDLRPEWGRADFDQRHRSSLVGTVDLPKDLRFATIVTVGSGVPYDITTGGDDNRDTVANERPPGLTRNTGDGPGLARCDLRVTKMFRVPRLLDRKRDHTSRNVELSIDFFNVLNHTNFKGFIGAQTSPFFGRANAAEAPRTIQFSARYRF